MRRIRRAFTAEDAVGEPLQVGDLAKALPCVRFSHHDSNLPGSYLGTAGFSTSMTAKSRNSCWASLAAVPFTMRSSS